MPSIGRETKQIDFVMAARCSNYYRFDFIDGTTKNNRSRLQRASLSFISPLFSSNDRGLIDAYLIRAIVEFVLFFHHSSHSHGNEKVWNENGKTV